MFCLNWKLLKARCEAGRRASKSQTGRRGLSYRIFAYNTLSYIQGLPLATGVPPSGIRMADFDGAGPDWSSVANGHFSTPKRKTRNNWLLMGSPGPWCLGVRVKGQGPLVRVRNFGFARRKEEQHIDEGQHFVRVLCNLICCKAGDKYFYVKFTCLALSFCGDSIFWNFGAFFSPKRLSFEQTWENLKKPTVFEISFRNDGGARFNFVSNIDPSRGETRGCEQDGTDSCKKKKKRERETNWKAHEFRTTYFPKKWHY